MSEASPRAPDRDSDRGKPALLLIDVLNCFDFSSGERLRRQARALVDPILRLRDQMDALGAPTIYVNDHFGEWHAEKTRLVARAMEAAPEIVGPLAPREQDFFVLKPQFSGFYATSLPLLLPKLGASRLVMTGLATDICVLFTAADAHMRDYALWAPEDAVAAERKQRSRGALEIMRVNLGAETRATNQLKVAAWLKALDRRGVR